MAKTLQINFFDRVGDALFMALLRAGVKMGPNPVFQIKTAEEPQEQSNEEKIVL
jgi:hypothetical protein